MSELHLRSATKRFGALTVIDQLDLDVGDKEFVVLVGPSGCGKSTLLRMIAGLEDFSGGELTIDGERMNEVPAARRGLAMVFQSYALYPHMTVAQNMSVGLRIAGEDKAVIAAKVAEAARTLQLEALLDRKPKALSGGQRQRVAIGRAIVRNPRIFLFDEPLSNLDAALRLQMRLELARLHDALDATMIYVTHDQVEAMTLADRIVVMNGGRIEQSGTPEELYERPANLFVAGFIGSPKMNLIEGQSDGNSVTSILGTIRVAARRGPVTLGVRPEHIRKGEEGGGMTLTGRVSAVERLGANSFAYLSLADGSSLTVELAGMTDIRPGADLPLSIPRDKMLVFDASGARVSTGL
ncbi:MAG: sn-glycerol-3-phosphate ABC transporter ATP-binding protein UgpC [Rhodobacteraceae bacterium]|nr:sn-glycerol-3-phosphate ABC transporter ATP-binding protein UgpC [Paracoccaceae bacterium]